MTFLFSSRLWWLKTLTTLALLILLGLHYCRLIEDLPHSWSSCVEEPSRCDGRSLAISLYQVRSISDPENYVIGFASMDIPIVGDSSGLELGQKISVQGIFDPSGPRIIADNYMLHNHRQAKVLLSALGMLVGLGAAIRFWRPTQEGLKRRA